MSRQRLGAFAELGNCKAQGCDLVPTALSLEEAAVFRNVYQTAYHALLQRGRLKPGEWVLIDGAAGRHRPAGDAVRQALQRADHRLRAPRKNARSAWSKAQTTLSITDRAFATGVLELTQGRGLDVIYIVESRQQAVEGRPDTSPDPDLRERSVLFAGQLMARDARAQARGSGDDLCRTGI
jgi:NADPH2:quinone reductase